VRQARRRGFTLIELLVVIGIIMVLVAILTYSYRAINRTAATKETNAELKICTGMLVNYEGRNGLNGIEFFTTQVKDTGTVSPPPPNTPNLYPVFQDPAAAMGGTNLTQTATASPPGTAGSCWPVVYAQDVTGTSTDMGDKAAGSARYGTAVQNTLDVSYVLVRIPENLTIAQGVQSKRIMEPILPTSGGTVTPNPITQGVILLDGWGNPIIFVPRGGLHVNIKDPSTGNLVTYVVRSTGSYPVTGSQDPPMTGNERPFFASAGQDGDFTQGEDNVYSFQE
jgi:prepilin-type N-terminal cleavage/methylation domain-containing protein